MLDVHNMSEQLLFEISSFVFYVNITVPLTVFVLLTTTYVSLDLHKSDLTIGA